MQPTTRAGTLPNPRPAEPPRHSARCGTTGHVPATVLLLLRLRLPRPRSPLVTPRASSPCPGDEAHHRAAPTVRCGDRAIGQVRFVGSAVVPRPRSMTLGTNGRV